MAREKKPLTKSKFQGLDEISTTRMSDQSGMRLEQLCEEREVGMDGVIHWKDSTFEEADIYNLMCWFELDSSRLNKQSIISELKVIKVLVPGILDPFQHLSKIMKADEGHLSQSNIYLNTGSFRYEEPEETRAVSDLNFVFNDITNIGFAGRSFQF